VYNSKSDKELECLRYNQRAIAFHESLLSCFPTGSSAVPLIFRSPYILYERMLVDLLSKHPFALELCAGMGEHTSKLVGHSEHLIATDISPQSLHILRQRFSQAPNLDTLVCDIESLPFSSDNFDLVACAGGLSYGDNQLVMNEIFRVLKPGGCFVCIDSLSNNPFYRFNRLIHYLRGRRSLSTLKRMPSLSLINKYQKAFSSVLTRYCGCYTWLVLPLSLFIGQEYSSLIINWLDSHLNIPCLAFKFILVVQKPVASS